MQDLISGFLSSYGLNEKDIAVYLNIYKYGSSIASAVSLRTSIDRTTVYSVIKRLVKRGLIVQTKNKNVLCYAPVAPQVFMDKLEKEIDEMAARKKSASMFVEEMNKISRISTIKPRTRIYEGREAIESLYRATLDTKVSQKSFVSVQRIPSELQHFLKYDFINLKKRRGVQSRVLIPVSSFAQKYKALDETSNRTTKIIKNHPFELHSEIILFNEKGIAIVDFQEHSMGIIIESATLYKSIEALFDYIWQSE